MTNKARFLKLIEEHNGILVKLTRIYADTAQDRDDLRQEIILRLWESHHRFENRSKFSSWMYRVGLNTAITFLKRNQKTATEAITDVNDSALVSVEASNANPSESVSELQIFYRSVAKLNPVEKAIVFLFMEGLSHREIAERLGISEGNARVKLSRTKQKLKEIARELGHGL